MNKTSGIKNSGKVSISKFSGLMILFVIISVVAFVWFQKMSISSPSVEQEKVIIAANTEYVGSCSVIVAQEKGYFTQEGILVNIQPYTSGKAAMEAITQKKADFGTVADIPVMFSGLNDGPVAVIATIFTGEKDHGIIGRKDKGVTVAANLKGKIIGVPLGTSAHFTLDALLNRQKLLPSEVKTRNYKPEDLSIALAEGDVDAIAIWEPFLGVAKARLGNNGIIFYGQDVYESIYNIIGVRSYISDHPETIRKILRALISGAKLCNENPDIAQEMVSKVTKIKIETLKTSWSSYRFDIVLDQGLILALEDEARWAIKNKMTSTIKMPNYLNSIYIDGLEAVRPSAVSVIH